jgi:hypothetical protein
VNRLRHIHPRAPLTRGPRSSQIHVRLDAKLRLAPVVAAAALLAGCAGHAAHTASPSTRPTAVCRSLALAAVDDAHGLLRAYGGDASPGDLAFYDLREHLAYLQSNGCRPQLLGGALEHGLSPKRLRTFLGLLPAAHVRYLRQALACADGRPPAEGCTDPATVIALPGAGKPGGTAHPVAP